MDVIDDTEEEAPPYFDPIAFAEKIGGLGDVLADMAIVYARMGTTRRFPQTRGSMFGEKCFRGRRKG